MNTSQTTASIRFKVGLFTLVGLAMVGAITVYVNDKPFWWRSCQLVHINVEDATGLKSKSPVRSLGLEIGYLESVQLSETSVDLGICITAPVEVLPVTKAYIKADGFLGDKFVELKPVKYIGAKPETKVEYRPFWKRIFTSLSIAEAFADDQPTAPGPAESAEGPAPAPMVHRNRQGNKEIPVGESQQDVQHIMERVDELVHQVSGLANNLQKAINPEDLRRTMKELNRTLENASKTLSPEGGLNQTAQRTLAKLEDAIEQLRDMVTRVNKGEGSVGMLLNDPSYAEEIRLAIKNVNRLLTKVGDVRFVVDIGGSWITGYNSGRGWAELNIWPKFDKYYRVGICVDPRGKSQTITATTIAGGSAPIVTQTTLNDPTGILITGMVGKVFWERLDISVGALYGDASLSVMGDLWLKGQEDRLQVRNDVYTRGGSSGIADRVTLTVKPWMGLYARVGVEAIPAPAPFTVVPIFFGAGITFDDEDVKLLFALK